MYSLTYDSRHACESDYASTSNTKTVSVPLLRERKIAVVGLGDSGMQFATKLGGKRNILAFDINATRIAELAQGLDRSGSFSSEDLKATNIVFSARLSDLAACDFFIISVPVSLDSSGRPDVGPVLDVSTVVGSCLKPGDIVVYTSTIFSGATEEYCIPVLELASGYSAPADFAVGFSPSSINFGDGQQEWPYLLNLIAGQDAGTLNVVKEVFSKIYPSGLCEAPSIRAAEAAESLNGIASIRSLSSGVANFDVARRQRTRSIVCHERWA